MINTFEEKYVLGYDNKKNIKTFFIYELFYIQACPIQLSLVFKMVSNIIRKIN